MCEFDQLVVGIPGEGLFAARSMLEPYCSSQSLAMLVGYMDHDWKSAASISGKAFIAKWIVNDLPGLPGQYSLDMYRQDDLDCQNVLSSVRLMFVVPNKKEHLRYLVPLQEVLGISSTSALGFLTSLMDPTRKRVIEHLGVDKHPHWDTFLELIRHDNVMITTTVVGDFFNIEVVGANEQYTKLVIELKRGI